MITTADVNAEVESRRLKLIERRVIRSEAILSIVDRTGRSFKEASDLFAVIDLGLFEHIKVNYGVKDANK